MPVQEVSQELPHFSMRYTVYLKNEPDIRYTYEGNVPEEVLDQFQKIVGNGLARVSLSIPIDLKDFGNGAGAHVSISLTCNQDAATIHQAHTLALQAAMHYVKADLAQAIQEFDQIQAQRKGQVPPPGQQRAW
jgi:hypothetical protein